MSSPDRASGKTPPPSPETSGDDDKKLQQTRHQEHRRGEKKTSADGGGGGGGGPLAGVKVVFLSAFRLDEDREKHRENVVQCVDVDERVWLPPKPLPFDVHPGAALCQQGKHIFLIGGVAIGKDTGATTWGTGSGAVTGTVTFQFLKYDLQQNSVQQCETSGLVARVLSASFAAANGRIYVLGGTGFTGGTGGTDTNTKKPLDSVQCYENDTWKTLAPLLFAMATPMASVFDGKCYVIGVSDAPTPSVRLQVNAFTSDDTWTEVSLPITIQPRISSATALVYRDGTLQVHHFLEVPHSHGLHSWKIETYDAAGKTWTSRIKVEADDYEQLVCLNSGEGAAGAVGPLAFAGHGGLPLLAMVLSTGAEMEVDNHSQGGSIYYVPHYEELCPSLYTFGL